MEVFIQNQLIKIVYSSILGLIFGGIYDIIRTIHIVFGIASYTGKSKGMRRGAALFVFLCVLDFIYILTVTCIFSVFLYAVNNGGFRFYLLAAVLGGMLLYFLTVSKIIMWLSERIVRFLRKLFMRIVLKPIACIIRWLGRQLRWIGVHTIGRMLRYLHRRRVVAHTKKRIRRLRANKRSSSEHDESEQGEGIDL